MRTNKLLWTVQIVLAALFVFSGVFKLVMPPAAFNGPFTLPVGFIRFIGVAELLGGIGLVVPFLTKIHPELTPAAAAGLTIGATVLTAATMSAAPAVVPLIVGLLTTSVAYGRRSALGDLVFLDRLDRTVVEP
jgi:hypothetical protein